MTISRGDVVKVNGEEWEVVGVGASEKGAIYVHLKSTTRSIAQKNGARPVQSCGWLRGDSLEQAP